MNGGFLACCSPAGAAAIAGPGPVLFAMFVCIYRGLFPRAVIVSSGLLPGNVPADVELRGAALLALSR